LNNKRIFFLNNNLWVGGEGGIGHVVLSFGSCLMYVILKRKIEFMLVVYIRGYILLTVVLVTWKKEEVLS
jgi:hypothetical protein